MGPLSRVLEQLFQPASEIDRDALLAQLHTIEATPAPNFGPEVCEGCQRAETNRQARERWEYTQTLSRDRALGLLQGAARPPALVAFGNWLRAEYETIRWRPENWLGGDWTEERRKDVAAVFAAVGREAGELWRVPTKDVPRRLAELHARIVATRAEMFTATPERRMYDDGNPNRAPLPSAAAVADLARRRARLQEVAGP